MINFFKNLFIAILDFLLSLFHSDSTSSESHKSKKITDKVKDEPKKDIPVDKNEVTNRSDNDIKSKSIVSYIDFNESYKKIIEEITGIKIKKASLDELKEINIIKDIVYDKVLSLEEISYFTSKDDEIKYLKIFIFKQVEKSLILPILKPVVKNEEPEKEINVIPIKKEREIEKQIIKEEEKKEKVLNSTPVIVTDEKIDKEIIHEDIIIPIIPKGSDNQDEKKNEEEEINLDVEIINEEELVNTFNEIKETIIKKEEEIKEKKNEEKEIIKKEEKEIKKVEDKIIIKEEKTTLKKEDIKEKKEEIKTEPTNNDLLNEELKTNELQTINSLMNSIYVDSKLDMNEHLINEIEDLNKMTLSELKDVEKKLLKKRLKKASKAIEPPLLLSLPFVRNKFFFAFTAGLFLHNHLNIIDSIYNRKTIEYHGLNEKEYIKGSKALDNAITLNQSNFKRVESIKENYLKRYPELINDQEFVNSIIVMESKLQNQEDKLLSTYNKFDNTKKKQNKIVKKLVLEKKNNQS